MNYREDKRITEKNKREYLDGINKIIKEKQKNCEKIRENYIQGIFSEREKYLNDFKDLLGWPLVNNESADSFEVISEKLSDEDGYSVYRMQFEVLKGLKMTGLFFKVDGNEAKPLVIVQHGGLGNPELLSGVYGETFNYNDMLHRVRQHNVHAFAPQLLLWSEHDGVEFDRKAIDAQLKAVGSSITAIEVYGITKIIDYFEKEPFVSNFGMIGLSYGGFYTLYTAAIDERIKAAISCSYFNKRDVINWSDWLWFKSADKFDDAEVACLIYPRKLFIEMGDKDEIFNYEYSVESFERLKNICKNVGTDWVDFILFDGTHEFCKDNVPINRFIQQLNQQCT